MQHRRARKGQARRGVRLQRPSGEHRDARDPLRGEDQDVAGRARVRQERDVLRHTGQRRQGSDHDRSILLRQKRLQESNRRRFDLRGSIRRDQGDLCGAADPSRVQQLGAVRRRRAGRRGARAVGEVRRISGGDVLEFVREDVGAAGSGVYGGLCEGWE